MSNVGEVVMGLVMLWLVVAIVRGLAFDIWNIGEEPGGQTGEDDFDRGRTFQQRRQSRIAVAYPLMGVLVIGLLVLLLR